MSDSVRTALFGSAFALLGTIGGAAITGWSQVELARQKFNSDLVLKALESASPQERLESLNLIVETHLLKDAEIQQGVIEYAKKKQADPSTIPQVGTAAKFDPPIISNSRIYLLAGTRTKEALFASYRQELEAAGFRVLGTKFLVDEGRPESEEVRFFYPEDQAQADKIAEVVGFKLAKAGLRAQLYADTKVKPGYIEIWFGK